MKHNSYYKTLDITAPDKTKYTKSFFYKKGKLIAVKLLGVGYDDLEVDIDGSVEEQIFDDVSYNEHLSLYHSKLREKQEEFKNDLFEKYGVVNHPLSDKIFLIAWQSGSGNFNEVDLLFSDFIELFEILNKKTISNLYKDCD
jgi:hypothetical protein